MMKKIDMIKEAKAKGIDLRFTGHGMAYRYGNIIIMNRHLVEYPKLCREIFNHELRHSSGYEKKDIIMDMTEGSFIENMKFCVRHPYGLTHFIPVSCNRGVWSIDVNHIVMYIIIIVCLIAFFALSK